MKILSSKQIKKWDSYTISHKPIKAIDLMEKAAKACVKWLKEHYENSTVFYVFCGHGDNGGDGLSIARNLETLGHNVVVYVIRSSKYSIGFSSNLQRCYEDKMIVNFISDKNDFPNHIPKASIIIDALLGIGLKDNLYGVYEALVKHLNKTGCEVVSIDVPSGLPCDNLSKKNNLICITAKHTLTFELPKYSFLLPETAYHVGQWHLLSIGLEKDFLKKISTPHYYTTREDVEKHLKLRHKFSHKGIYGHVLLVAGSKGKMGAAVLSGMAALRSGVGLLSIHTPKCGYHILQSVVPESMVQEDIDNEYISHIHFTDKHLIAIGPGIGKSLKTTNALLLLLKHHNKPMILDADAINIISENRSALKDIPPKSILTPHQKEFSRLVGDFENDKHKIDLLKIFSKKYDCYVVLKGAYSIISTPEGELFFNSTGNPGMATGGSGDVLTGVLASLLAQGYDSKSACIIGTFLHGKSADIIVEKSSPESLIARDIIEGLGEAYHYIRGKSSCFNWN